jgi:dipicolinate synthase subunit A
MVSNKKFTIIGGDLRSVKLSDILAKEGNFVNIFGFNLTEFELKKEESQDLETAIDESDVIIGPIPCSNDDENLNAPFHSEKINIKETFKIMKKNQLFVAGRISEKVSQLAQVCNVYTVDLLQREEMAVLNAIPTAEGAIQIAMEEMAITLHNSNILVLGFGRIGKTLSKMLNGLGAKVFCEARKYSDVAWIKSYGYNPVPLNEIVLYLSDMDVIFNTIPNMVLDYNLLSKINKDCLIIDLASKPGGIDFESAQKLGLNTIWALSLPGKVAPITAAYIIKETVYNIIEELGV